MKRYFVVLIVGPMIIFKLANQLAAAGFYANLFPGYHRGIGFQAGGNEDFDITGNQWGPGAGYVF